MSWLSSAWNTIKAPVAAVVSAVPVVGGIASHLIDNSNAGGNAAVASLQAELDRQRQLTTANQNAITDGIGASLAVIKAEQDRAAAALQPAPPLFGAFGTGMSSQTLMVGGVLLLLLLFVLFHNHERR